MVALLVAMVLTTPILIVLLRSYEYEGDNQMVAITSFMLHGVFTIAVCLAIVILIMAVIA